ncbi:gliding motility-associated C-terminal domain-containing protein, partial [Crocinitomix sp.]|nr:gliding motility-associated C-terminal domain-containing protein [Crocinitomix sp.]
TYTAKGQTYNVDVCLVALNKNGCTDTACKVITIYEPIVFTQINIFTPNGDGINDVFSFDFRASSITDFSCVIVNRWGIVVHEMDNITDAWDGTDKSGSPCNDGTYFYTYSATADDGTKLSGQGNVSLVGGK